MHEINIEYHIPQLIPIATQSPQAAKQDDSKDKIVVGWIGWQQKVGAKVIVNRLSQSPCFYVLVVGFHSGGSVLLINLTALATYCNAPSVTTRTCEYVGAYHSTVSGNTTLACG